MIALFPFSLFYILALGNSKCFWYVSVILSILWLIKIDCDFLKAEGCIRDKEKS